MSDVPLGREFELKMGSKALNLTFLQQVIMIFALMLVIYGIVLMVMVMEVITKFGKKLQPKTRIAFN